VTRASAETVGALQAAHDDVLVDGGHRCGRRAAPRPGTVAVLAAGTSDGAVAAEAALTARAFGANVERVDDVGVSGLHRLMAARPALDRADCLVVVAGMEGALPSVVGGLVGTPLVAVPTSIGYGASFGGLAALLAMLNACAPASPS
jgi:NCAIR mutase (PurE)-related protein